MVFKAKKDLLYRLVFYSSFALFIIGFVSGINSREWLTITLMPLVFILFAWIWFGSRYTLVDDVLLVELGPFKRKITISKIKNVRKTNSILASASLATERLEISYGSYDRIQISPVELDRFIAKLQQINSEITIIT